jgi:hypothetical protein
MEEGVNYNDDSKIDGGGRCVDDEYGSRGRGFSTDEGVKSNHKKKQEDVDYNDSTSTSAITQIRRIAVRLVDTPTDKYAKWFTTISVATTLLGTCLEIFSTCDFAQDEIWIKNVTYVEGVAVIWFTLEYAVHTCAHGWGYTTSALGFINFVATFPWYVARGLLGMKIAAVVNSYDGRMRVLRLLGLVRLDAYSPRYVHATCECICIYTPQLCFGIGIRIRMCASTIYLLHCFHILPSPHSRIL